MYTKPTVNIVENAAVLAERAAGLFVILAKEAIKRQGAFFVAVSGGSTPRAMHQLLAEMPYREEVSWKNLHLFWVDDRCVPYSHSASNFGAAEEDFITRVPLPEGQVHPIQTEMAPEEGAAQYQGVLGAVPVASSGFPRFDVVFLGIGPDGHTASLFPGQKVLEEKKRWVVAVKGGSPDVHRITMTFPVLNQARHVVFLASGAEKASIVKAVLEGEEQSLPAQRICPADGLMTWLLDRGAASQLSFEVPHAQE